MATSRIAAAFLFFGLTCSTGAPQAPAPAPASQAAPAPAQAPASQPAPAAAAQAAPAAAGINFNDPKALLAYAASVNGLDSAAGAADPNVKPMTPWHLRATYETFDEKGEQSGSGVFEEWHISANRWKRSYTGSHFTQTEYETADGHYYETGAGGAPWPDSLIQHALIHPMPSSEDTEDTAPTLQDQSFGKVKLACMMFTQANLHESFGTKLPLGLFPTYCFSKQDAILRFRWFDGSIQEIFNKLALFEGRYIAREIELSDDTRPLIHIHLQELRSMTAAESASLTPPASAARADKANVQVAPGVIAGHRLRGTEPMYPSGAKALGVKGTVVLKALIGTDGRIQQVRVVSSPHSLLTIAAIEAVGRWVYQPYLLSGLPVNVLTTVNVVFGLSRDAFGLGR